MGHLIIFFHYLFSLMYLFRADRPIVNNFNRLLPYLSNHGQKTTIDCKYGVVSFS